MTTLVFAGSLLAAMALGMPIAIALLVCALALMAYQGPFELTILSQKLIEGADSYPLLAIPFFVLAGELMNAGGMSRRIVDAAMACVGHVRGGLGYVAVFAAMLMAAMSGSATADAAVLGAILLPMMRSAGYDVPRSAGLIASASCIAPVLPPSVALVIFGVIANVSIGKLFMAGIVPALLMGLALLLTWAWMSRGTAAATLPRASGRERWLAIRRAGWSLAMPVGVVGGMKAGLFTATEAAVVACAYAFVIGAFVYRELPVRRLYPIIVASTRTTAVVTFLIATALVSAWLITVSAVPQQISEALQPLHDDPRLLMAVIMLVVLVVGTALDFAPTLMILTPVLMPVVKSAGIDPVYFGILFIMNNAIGLVTPPVGIVLNVVSGVGKVALGDVIRGSWPFVVAQTAVLALLVAFPPIVLVPLRWLTG
jgi:tripartite ATP-independent transporter DctM subunit